MLLTAGGIEAPSLAQVEGGGNLAVCRARSPALISLSIIGLVCGGKIPAVVAMRCLSAIMGN